jgi:hypothetical protein
MNFLCKKSENKIVILVGVDFGFSPPDFGPAPSFGPNVKTPLPSQVLVRHHYKIE